LQLGHHVTTITAYTVARENGSLFRVFVLSFPFRRDVTHSPSYPAARATRCSKFDRRPPTVKSATKKALPVDAAGFELTIRTRCTSGCLLKAHSPSYPARADCRFPPANSATKKALPVSQLSRCSSVLADSARGGCLWNCLRCRKARDVTRPPIPHGPLACKTMIAELWQECGWKLVVC